MARHQWRPELHQQFGAPPVRVLAELFDLDR